MEQIVHPISLTEIIPLNVQPLPVLLLGGGSFAQLLPPCPRMYVALCESDVHLHKGSKTSEKLFGEVFCLAYHCYSLFL